MSPQRKPGRTLRASWSSRHTQDARNASGYAVSSSPPSEPPAHRLEDRLRGQHPGLHRGVGALDLGRVEGARLAADQHPARERELREALEAALVDGAGAVGDPPPALEGLADLRVGLEALHLLERREVRVLVVEPDDEADRDLGVLEVVEERPAVGARVERPARGVHDEPRAVPLGPDLPELLDPDAVGLRLDPVAKAEALHQPEAEVAAAPLGEEGVLRAELHAGHEVVGGLAVAPHPHVPGDDPADRAVLAVQHVGGGEAGEHLRPQLLRLRGEPPAEVPEADDVVAVVLERGREQTVRPREPSPLGEEEEAFLRHLGVDGRLAVAPVREELLEGARLEHRAGEDVGADLGPLLDHADAQVVAALLGELAKPHGRGEARRSRPDDHHVELHGFAFDRRLVHPSAPVPPPVRSRLLPLADGPGRAAAPSTPRNYKVPREIGA